MTPRRRRLTLVLGVLVGVAIAGGLTLRALRANVMFFFDPSQVAAGEAPHSPHQHIHEEMVLVREGELEVTIAGQATRLGAGSAAFISSNQMHGWRNTGSAPARYFVFALGDDNA